MLPKHLSKDTFVKLSLMLGACALFVIGHMNYSQEFVNTIEIKVSECQCRKQIPLEILATSLKSVDINATTCSEDVHALGSGQKVIAFTFYGDATYDTLARDYFAGVEKNLKAMKELYPVGFRMRLYYQMPKKGKLFNRVCQMACKEPQLDICDVENNPKYGNAR